MNRKRIGMGMAWILAGAWAAGGLVATAPALGQQVFMTASAGGPGEFGEGAISARSLERYGELLGFDETQGEDARLLHEGYLAEYKKSSETMRREMRAAQQEFQDSEDFEEFHKATRKAMDAHREATEKAESAFMADVRSLLSSGQEERWPKLERLRRREDGLRYGMLSGERLDLTEVVRGLKVTGVEGLPDEIEQYEAELDRAIVERRAIMDEQQEGVAGGDMITIVEGEEGELAERMAEMREAGLKIREINQRHARLIQGMLSEADAARFHSEVRKRSFPQVHRKTHAQRVLESALAFDDLTGDQRRELESIRASYEREADAANNAWMDEIAKEEESSTGGAMMLGGGQVMRLNFGDEQEGPVADARKARREIDRKMRDRVEGTLTEKQKGRLPEPGSEPGQGGGEEGVHFVTESVIIQR